MGIGIGIGMETPDLRAGWPRGGFDATQNRIVGLASAPPRGRAEDCVIVTGYLRTEGLGSVIRDMLAPRKQDMAA